MNIIVTGASRGIGFETVRSLAGNPDMRILAIARNIKNLRRLKSCCASLPSGNDVNILATDLSQNDRLQAEVIPMIQKMFSKLDILINNAGYLVNKPFNQINEHELEMTLKVNFMVPWQMIQSLSGLLIKAGKAHVINISSIGGMQGSVKFPGLSAYSCAKGALGILTECLAVEFNNTGVAFNCLALGAVQTEMFGQAFPGYSAPLKPAEMAAFITDFAIHGSTYFNGKILPVSVSTP
jgi:NAD(P)-dependent dehydrogenase (short-subunit alcohol dehydrogenase family)